MDTKELRTFSADRLREMIAKATAEIRDLRFSVWTRQESHVRKLRHAKREIARMHSVLCEKENEVQPTNV